MWYSFVRSLLFKLDPECSHELAFSLFKFIQCYCPYILATPVYHEGINCFGIHFPNRVGLAAGLDKNGECVPFWQSLGFGFIEVGTVTPRSQPGNPRPRLFRYPQYEAIVNRMGFNNKGIDYLIENLSHVKRTCPIGINIGKNKDTPLEQAVNDYLYCFEKAYPWADYIVINISSPNTPGLRTLLQRDMLTDLILPLLEARKKLTEQYQKRVPLVVKISPDLLEANLIEVIDVLLALKIDAVIATNTTVSRPNEIQEEGGLSGAPLFEKSLVVVKTIVEKAGIALPVIASGGIMSSDQAREMFEAGASLIQLYSGFIYKGPQIIQECLTT